MVILLSCVSQPATFLDPACKGGGNMTVRWAPKDATFITGCLFVGFFFFSYTSNRRSLQLTERWTQTMLFSPSPAPRRRNYDLEIITHMHSHINAMQGVSRARVPPQLIDSVPPLGWREAMHNVGRAISLELFNRTQPSQPCPCRS